MKDKLDIPTTIFIVKIIDSLSDQSLDLIKSTIDAEIEHRQSEEVK